MENKTIAHKIFVYFIYLCVKQKQVITIAHEVQFKHTNNISPILLHHNLCITLLIDAETVLVKQPCYIQTKMSFFYIINKLSQKITNDQKMQSQSGFNNKKTCWTMMGQATDNRALLK